MTKHFCDICDAECLRGGNTFEGPVTLAYVKVAIEDKGEKTLHDVCGRCAVNILLNFADSIFRNVPEVHPLESVSGYKIPGVKV